MRPERSSVETTTVEGITVRAGVITVVVDGEITVRAGVT